MPKEFRLSKIELYNIFNYRGKHTIDFSTERPGNIFLFNIQNGGGKTSLFLAIKWGFYGRDSGIEYIKDGVKLTNREFMNTDEQEEGRFHVKIAFTYDSREMELRRECPDYNSDDTMLTLKVDGIVERDQVARSHIAKIIPPDYGDFFMFNGEVLEEIANNQRDVRKTDSVLKLLGLKQLNDLMGELSSIQRAMTSEFSKISNVGSEFSHLNEELGRLSDKYERIKSTLDTRTAERDDVQNTIWTLENERRKYSNIQGTIESIETKKRQIREKKEEREYASSYIRNHASGAFVLFLTDNIDGIVDKLEIEKSELVRENRRMPNASSGKYLETQKDIVSEHLMQCPVCKSMITPDTLQAIQDILNQSNTYVQKYSENEKRIREIRTTVESLKKRKSMVPCELNKMCTSLFDLTNEIQVLEDEILHLNEIVGGSNVDAIKSISNELSGLYKKKSDLDKVISDESNILKNTETNLRKIRLKINNSQGLNDKQKDMSRHMNYLDTLIRKLDRVIQSASKRKRSDILAKADMVFTAITNKPEIYKGLEYDDRNSFAMHIVRRDGKTVINPSSGEKHVLALSFLISLSLNTERLNPMMMDTPLSRLDEVHRTNIGSALSRLQNQIIFLAQPGEMDPRTLEYFKPSVTKYFEAVPDENNGACIMEGEL